MAIMIPETIGFFDPASGEDLMFEALSKLPNDYYIIHSFHLNYLIPNKGLNENEIDFIIFNPHYGYLFVEAKNSRVTRDEHGQWWYQNDGGQMRKMRDPFNQAYGAQHNLFNYLRDKYNDQQSLDDINDCKFLVAVWLPKYTKKELAELDFGPNAPKELILPKEAVNDPMYLESRIKNLMSQIEKIHIVAEIKEIDWAGGYKQKLSPEDSLRVFNEMICPTLQIVTNTARDRSYAYIRLLEEQRVVLDYLQYQRSAAISGASGTGKTLVAVERARRLSAAGEKVLFICFNRDLVDYLNETYHDFVSNKEQYSNVFFTTINGLGCKICKVLYDQVNYNDLADFVEMQMKNGTFEYQHIIIDEGQDFGRTEIEASMILDLFNEYGTKPELDTSFFIFYDKNQLVNSRSIPDYLTNVDSKLTLYRNCRNTHQIADTAYSTTNDKPIMFDNCIDGPKPVFVTYKSKEEFVGKLNKILDEITENNTFDDRKIVTLHENIKNSEIYPFINEKTKEYIYNSKATRVYTSATVKGLEADDVILLDLNKECFDVETDEAGNVVFYNKKGKVAENGDLNPIDKRFYVAASRAKHSLFIFVSMTEEDIKEVIDLRFKNSPTSSNNVKRLAIAMGGTGKIR